MKNVIEPNLEFEEAVTSFLMDDHTEISKTFLYNSVIKLQFEFMIKVNVLKYCNYNELGVEFVDQLKLDCLSMLSLRLAEINLNYCKGKWISYFNIILVGRIVSEITRRVKHLHI